MFITKKRLEKLIDDAKNEAASEVQEHYEHNYEMNNVHTRINEVIKRVEALENVLNSQGSCCSGKKTLNE